MKNLLAAIDTRDVIGTINPPVSGSPLYTGDTNAGLATLISTAIQLFLLVAGLAALLYMMLGAFEWITSNGEKEKILKAQNKIQAAAIGIVLTVVVLVVFNVIMGTILGGKFGIGNGFQITLPTIGGP